MTPRISVNIRPGSGQFLLGTAGLVFLAVYAAAIAFPAGEGYLRIQSNILYNIPATVALALVLRRAYRSSRMERWGWGLFAVMLATWLGADWTYSYYDLGLNRDLPFPSLVDGFYTAGYASMLLAIVLLAYPRRLVASLRWLLDVILIMTVVGAFEWVLIMEPIVAEAESSTFESAVALSYPLWDIGLIAVIVGAMLAWHGNLAGRSKVLLAAMASLAITDSLYSYGVVLTGYENVGNPLELGWLLSYLLIGLAATMEPERSDHLERRLPVFWLVFPFVLALPLPIVEGVRAAISEDVDVLSLGGAAVLLMAFLSHIHASYMTSRALDTERRRARLDSLTGTLNHGGIIEEAEALIAANPRQRLSVAMVDVDGLKAINDILGHQIGDLALKVVATRLRRSGGIVGRYGGDEFLVLFEPHHSVEGHSPANLLRQAVAGAFVGANSEAHGDITVGASFGLCDYPDEAPDLPSAIEIADAAMYEQKRARRRESESQRQGPAPQLSLDAA